MIYVIVSNFSAEDLPFFVLTLVVLLPPKTIVSSRSLPVPEDEDELLEDDEFILSELLPYWKLSLAASTNSFALSIGNSKILYNKKVKY